MTFFSVGEPHRAGKQKIWRDMLRGGTCAHGFHEECPPGFSRRQIPSSRHSEATHFFHQWHCVLAGTQTQFMRSLHPLCLAEQSRWNKSCILSPIQLSFFYTVRYNVTSLTASFTLNSEKTTLAQLCKSQWGSSDIGTEPIPVQFSVCRNIATRFGKAWISLNHQVYMCILLIAFCWPVWQK